RFEHTPRGLTVRYRLRYPQPDQQLILNITEGFEPLATGDPGRAGFQRSLTIERAPANSQWRLLVLPRDSQLDAAARRSSLAGPRGSVDVTLAASKSVSLSGSSQGTFANLIAD